MPTGSVRDRGQFTSDEERALVAELTRQALSAAAPEEVDLFAANEDLFLAGKAPPTQGSDEQLGFGIELGLLLTPYVVAAATAAVQVVVKALSNVAAAEAEKGVKAWLHRLLHPQDAEPQPLPADLLLRIRRTTYEVCEQMGAAASDAALVSDAVVGRLATG